MLSPKPDSPHFGLRDIGTLSDPLGGSELITPQEDLPEMVDDPVQILIRKREESLKEFKIWRGSYSTSKNDKNFFRMNGYKNPGVDQPLGGRRVIFEPPLFDSYSDVPFPVIKLSSLALENYNKREGTNYKYVGLVKAYYWSTSSTSSTFEIVFTAAEALQSIFESIHFQAKVCCKHQQTDGGKFTTVYEYDHVSKCPPSTHR